MHNLKTSPTRQATGPFLLSRAAWIRVRLAILKAGIHVKKTGEDDFPLLPGGRISFGALLAKLHYYNHFRYFSVSLEEPTLFT